MKTIVFDFDKTLSQKDSLTEFFLSDLHFPEKIFYLFLKVFSKFGLISILQEKTLVFSKLCHGSPDEIRQRLVHFAPQIKLNSIMNIYKQYKQRGDQIIILSASPEEYLKKIFPDEIVLGAVLTDNGRKITGFSQHPSGKEKYSVLIENEINHVDVMFYDSRSDEVLIPLCEEWNKVANGKVVYHGKKS